jgi:hypothetical protein
MPDHKTHRAVQKIFLGESFGDVDDFMDEPYRWRDGQGRMLKGRHRIYRHDALTPGMVLVRELLKSGDIEKAVKKGLAATLHLAADALL